MDEQINEKLDDLLKYIPFIDFVLGIDKDKYVKFIDIKNWIVNRKRYPLSDLNKIEQSIITLYKNLIALNDMKMSTEIMQIFCKEFKHEFVDLCSDDEEEDKTKDVQSNKSPKGSDSSNTVHINIDSDDDLEIVSFSYPEAQKTEVNTEPRLRTESVKNALDDTSAKLLRHFGDNFLDADIKSRLAKPHSLYGNNSDEQELFQRRTHSLFKRRNDYNHNANQNDSNKKENEDNSGQIKKHCSTGSYSTVDDTITLNSSDEETENSVNDEAIVLAKKNETVLGLNLPQKPNNIEDESKLSEVELNNPNSMAKGPSDRIVLDLNAASKPNCQVIEYPNNCATNTTSGNKPIRDGGILSAINSFELNSLEKFNIEELLSDDKVGENKTSDLENIFIKAIRRILHSSQRVNHQDGSKAFSNEHHSNPADNVSASAITAPPTQQHEWVGVTSNQTTTTTPPQLISWTNQHYQPPMLYSNPAIQPLHMPPRPYVHQQSIPLYNGSPIDPLKNMANLENSKDPRIRNLWKKLKNSPLLNPIERKTLASWGNVMPQIFDNCQPTKRPTAVNVNTQLNNHTPAAQPYYHTTSEPSNRMPPVSQSQIQNNYRMNEATSRHSISFAEYKRRGKSKYQLILDKQREYERKRHEAERKQKDLERREQEAERERQDEIKAQQELVDIETGDTQKSESTEDIRSILLNTLMPYQEKIASIMEQHKKPCHESLNHMDEDKPQNGDKQGNVEVDECIPKLRDERDADNESTVERLDKTVTHNSKKETSNKTNEDRNKLTKVNRVIKELECTFKGYELQDYIAKDIAGKRRSSVHARSAIAEQLNSLMDTDTNSLESRNELCLSSTSKRRKTIDNDQNPYKGKRRSSIHARSITEQLHFTKRNLFDQTVSSSESCSYTISKRRKTIDGNPTTEEIKLLTPSTISEQQMKSHLSVRVHTTTSKQLNYELNDDICGVPKMPLRPNISDKHAEQEIDMLHKSHIKKKLQVKLKRLTVDEIRKYVGCEEDTSNNILNVQLVESRRQPDEVVFKPTLSAKKPLPKTLNNDCEMTEINTRLCALCGCKPADLTNHYIRKHKSESYVSRLTWPQLDELRINTPFAKICPSSNDRLTLYRVTCPFCKEELVEPFIQLYNHYSTHTGEYAFQCYSCLLEKPFKADIRSHQLHSKTCRGSQVQVLYRYPSNTMVIYLHYCTLCNFVQLNEANIFRHLRDHHDNHDATPNNVQKCILAAISDGIDTSNAVPATVSSDRSDQHPPCQLVKTEANHKDEASSEENSNVVAINKFDFNDDNIPVRNEAHLEEHFDPATCHLEEKLREMHETPHINQSFIPMTVIPLTENTGSELTYPSPSRHVPKIYKPEPIDIEEKYELSLPLLPLNKSAYRSYPSNVKYLGLYKCMVDDCYYSTDSADEILKHLEDHDCDHLLSAHLQCAYCNIPEGVCKSPQQLVDHIQKQHLHMIYQCSMCCYRNCEASDVLLHQEENHSCQAYTIYKCPGPERPLSGNTSVSTRDDINVIEVNATLDSVMEEISKGPLDKVDIKPNAIELLKCHEENVKVRLRMLTEGTGIAPDILYQCPDQSCGGFFSNYDLWLRHMRIKHNGSDCHCPHCPVKSLRTLAEYKDHFEEHRRHTTICFYCPMTFPNSLLAIEHGSREHSDLGLMHLKQIRFNLNYSYFVLSQKEMLTNCSEFIPELLQNLNNRLKERETSDSMNLKSSWVVSPRTSSWLKDYQKYISRKLKKKCFNGCNCNFRAMESEELFKHARENHSITGRTFNCCQCDFRIRNCTQWDEVLSHIQQHSDNTFFICCVCVRYHQSRSKLANHILKEHATIDVPIINLIKKNCRTYLSVAVVFAYERLSFSTIKKCFCCDESDLDGDSFILHLKSCHNFVLNYFCEWCNLPIESPEVADEHFRQVHTRNRLKIRCEFASKSNILVESINNFKLHIHSNKSATKLEYPLGDNSNNIQRISTTEHQPPTNIVQSNPKSAQGVSAAEVQSSTNIVKRMLPRIKIVHGRKPK